MFGNPAAGRRGAGPGRLRAAVQCRGVPLIFGTVIICLKVGTFNSQAKMADKLAKCKYPGMVKMWPDSPVASVYENDLRVEMRPAGVQQQQPGLVSLDDGCGALVPQLAAISCALQGLSCNHVSGYGHGPTLYCRKTECFHIITSSVSL